MLSEDSDQPGHPPSLIRVFTVHMTTLWVLSYPLSAQRRLPSGWVDSQAELSFSWAHMPFCWFCHETADLTGNINIFFQIPFLPGDTDLDQLSKIFQVLGTPTKATWPVSLVFDFFFFKEYHLE